MRFSKLATYTILGVSFVATASIMLGLTFPNSVDNANVKAASGDLVTPVPVEAGELLIPEVNWDEFKPVDVATVGADDDPTSETSPVKESFKLVSLTSEDKITLTESGVEAVEIYAVEDKTVAAVPADKIEELNLSGQVEENQRITTFSETQTSPPSWGQDRIDTEEYVLDGEFNYDTTGAGVTVYIVDTGVNMNHSDFTGRLRTGFTTINDGRSWDDCNGHGTHVAGTVGGSTFGIAKDVNIVPVRVLNCAGSGYVSDIISGINWIRTNHVGGPAVINLSLGGGYSQILNDTVNNAISAGFHVVAAAGNSTSDACSFSPGSTRDAITVSAVSRGDVFASYSNNGSCVDVNAPGTSIMSAYVGSSTASATMTGTSMAAPHVSAAVARILETNPNVSPSEMAVLIEDFTVNYATSTPSNTTNGILVLEPVPEVVEAPVSPESSNTPTATPMPSEPPTASPEPSESPSVTPEPSDTPVAEPLPKETPKPSPTPLPQPEEPTVEPAPLIPFEGLQVNATSHNMSLLTWRNNKDYINVSITVTDKEGNVQNFNVVNRVPSLLLRGLTPDMVYTVEAQATGKNSDGDFVTEVAEVWFITKASAPTSSRNNDRFPDFFKKLPRNKTNED